jgi:small-conductance mechanosensitive channel
LQEDAKISDIIQFRQSLSFLNTSFPFSVAFGAAGTREQCIESTEKVYARLLLNAPGTSVLNFDTLALLVVQPDGTLDLKKLKDIVRLFRPDREGKLSPLDFAKSIDACYKELRLLRASVANSSRIDKAFERIFNIFFYFIVGCIVLAVLGVDPLTLFASVSGFVLGFAFMIGSACSKIFEGLLLILVRRPYDIGDRINVRNHMYLEPV